MQQVDDGLKARDGKLFLFLAADWENADLDIKPFVVSKNITKKKIPSDSPLTLGRTQQLISSSSATPPPPVPGAPNSIQLLPTTW